MAEIERQTKRYPTDLTDAEWAHVEPFLPKPERTGRRREVDLREVLNAIRYVARTGCGWRMLPKDFPPWQTVYYYLRRWEREGVWARVHHALLLEDSERSGREPSPSAAVLDSQTVRTADQKGDSKATMPESASTDASAIS